MMFRWDPPYLDPAWQELLDRLAPRTERGPAWLKLAWHPGETWSPVQRWVVYQMVPLWRAPEIIRHDLLGPNPRQFGHWTGTEFIRVREFSVDRLQWELHQQTGCYAKPLWVIQGDGGGHKRRWDEFEAGISIALGGGETPPKPGDLRYTDPDNRMIEKLRALDLVIRYRNRLTDFVNRPESMVDQEARDAERAMRQVVWDVLSEQIEDSLELTHAELGTVRDEMKNAPINTRQKRRPIDGDEIRDQFLTRTTQS